jgi:hypothetical protein
MSGARACEEETSRFVGQARKAASKQLSAAKPTPVRAFAHTARTRGERVEMTVEDPTLESKPLLSPLANRVSSPARATAWLTLSHPPFVLAVATTTTTTTITTAPPNQFSGKDLRLPAVVAPRADSIAPVREHSQRVRSRVDFSMSGLCSRLTRRAGESHQTSPF